MKNLHRLENSFPMKKASIGHTLEKLSQHTTKRAYSFEMYFRYLGTFIDTKLSWKVQIQHIKTKLARGIGLISKISHFVDQACLLRGSPPLAHASVFQKIHPFIVKQ